MEADQISPRFKVLACAQPHMTSDGAPAAQRQTTFTSEAKTDQLFCILGKLPPAEVRAQALDEQACQLIH